MRYIVVLRGTKVIGAKDSAFILLRLRRNSPGLAVREIHPEGWGLPASSFAILQVKYDPVQLILDNDGSDFSSDWHGCF